MNIADCCNIHIKPGFFTPHSRSRDCCLEENFRERVEMTLRIAPCQEIPYDVIKCFTFIFKHSKQRNAHQFKFPYVFSAHKTVRNIRLIAYS